jgi:hypothetical protein
MLYLALVACRLPDLNVEGACGGDWAGRRSARPVTRPGPSPSAYAHEYQRGLARRDFPLTHKALARLAEWARHRPPA